MKKKKKFCPKPQASEVLYRYQAKVLRVVDGDTIDCRVELGFRVQQEIRFRLAEIDAPEIRGKKAAAAGVVSMEWLENRLSPFEFIYVVSEKTGKYGRWLAHIYTTPDGPSVNREMIEKGLAKPYG